MNFLQILNVLKLSPKPPARIPIFMLTKPISCLYEGY